MRHKTKMYNLCIKKELNAWEFWHDRFKHSVKRVQGKNAGKALLWAPAASRIGLDLGSSYRCLPLRGKQRALSLMRHRFVRGDWNVHMLKRLVEKTLRLRDNVPISTKKKLLCRLTRKSVQLAQLLQSCQSNSLSARRIFHPELCFPARQKIIAIFKVG
jgi:hypothetical protein